MNYYTRRRSDPDYTRIMNGQIQGPNGEKWKTFAAQIRQRTQVCEQCGRAEMPGVRDSKLAVHHIRPISSFSNLEEKRRWAFLPENLTVLCRTCHNAAHRELGSYDKETRKQHQDNVRREFAEKFLPSVFRRPGEEKTPKSLNENLRLKEEKT